MMAIFDKTTGKSEFNKTPPADQGQAAAASPAKSPVSTVDRENRAKLSTARLVRALPYRRQLL